MKESIHFIGVGGIGMSALATLLLEQKKSDLFGSDINISNSYMLSSLQEKGLTLFQGHSADHLHPSLTRVVVSSDIPKDNPEVIEAKKRSLPILHRSDLLQEIMEPFSSLVVTGTHGKTTTSSLLAHVFTLFSETDPDYTCSFAVGGIVKNYSTNARYSRESSYFIAEADESDATFLKYTPSSAIVTNIDSDHLAHYGSIEALEAAFKKFCSKVLNNNGTLVLCGDCARLQNMDLRAIYYGFKLNNDVRLENLTSNVSGTFFDLIYSDGKKYRSIFIPLYGSHNALNAAAVFILSLESGISEQGIRSAFTSFLGVKRRLDVHYKDHNNGIIVFDDYAHHPTEVKATLLGLRAAFSYRRIISIFQPHRPSRMRYVLDEFTGVFSSADTIFLTDLDSASEDDHENDAIMKKLQEILVSSHTGRDLFSIELDKLLPPLLSYVRPYDIILFMGAGGLSKKSQEFAQLLATSSITKYRAAIIYGGKSSENKISRISAQAVWNNIQEDIFDKKSFCITSNGIWRKTEEVEYQDPESSSSQKIPASVLQELSESDILFPVLHGPFGEDGSIQGLFEILDLAYVGSDHVGGSLAMDKSLSKIIVEHAGVPVVPFLTIRKCEWERDSHQILMKIQKALIPFPLFVKPVHLGSSVGVYKIYKEEELLSILNSVFQLDDKILIEQGLVSFREIEFAPMGNDFPEIPHPGEIISNGEIYDYKAKYGKNGFQTDIQADLSLELLEEGRGFAKKAYEALGLSGLCRIDFFLVDEKRWYFNEANPIPGFTEISLYPSIWKQAGVGYSQLILQLLLLGLQKQRARKIVTQSSIALGKQLELFCSLQKEQEIEK